VLFHAVPSIPRSSTPAPVGSWGYRCSSSSANAAGEPGGGEPARPRGAAYVVSSCTWPKSGCGGLVSVGDSMRTVFFVLEGAGEASSTVHPLIALLRAGKTRKASSRSPYQRHPRARRALCGLCCCYQQGGSSSGVRRRGCSGLRARRGRDSRTWWRTRNNALFYIYT
jgi:hypothetical protein